MDVLAKEPTAPETTHKPVMKEPAGEELVDEATKLQRRSNNNLIADKELLENSTSGSLGMVSAKKDSITFLEEVEKDVMITEFLSYELSKQMTESDGREEPGR